MLTLTSCSVDLLRGTVARDNATLSLTTREADLLRYFMAHRSRIIPRDELLTQVWGYSDVVVSRACDNAVRRLREKIEADPGSPDHVLTVHGVGYRFEPAQAAPDGPTELPAAQPLIDLGEVRVDLPHRRLVHPDGDRLLTETEAVVLGALLRANGAVVEQGALAREAWGSARTQSRALVAVIHQLRAKLERDPASPTLLLTARGRGYRLERPTRAARDRPQTRLVGRDLLVKEVRARLDASERVVLLGPAGVGKSSVARAVFERSEAVWADLADAREIDDAAAQVARALGIELGAIPPIERIRSTLARSTSRLLILDHLDSLGASAASFVEVCVPSTPGLRVLATSRVRIGASGEAVIEVPPLDAPAAIALFIERARAVSSANAEIDRYTDVIADIVARLDRLPWAIELAAARTAALGPMEIQRRLDLDLLASPSGDPRHRSLRAAIRASIEALPDSARDALQDLSQFRSGFYLEDAEFLLGEQAIDALQLLRDHSLLRSERRETGLLFATWQAICEHYDLAGRPPSSVARYCRCLARFGEDLCFERLGCADTEPNFARMSAQASDLSRAARIALAACEAVLAGYCASAAASVAVESGPYPPALQLLQDVLAADLPDALRARLLLQKGLLSVYIGAPDEAALEGACALASQAEAWNVLHKALGELSDLRSRRGDHLAARAASVRAVDAARRWDPASGASERHESRVALYDWDELGVVSALERGVERARRSGQTLMLAEMLIDLGNRELFRGALRRSRAHLEEARALAEALGWPRLLTQATLTLLQTLNGAGAAQEAAQWAPIARDLAERLGSGRLHFLALHMAARALLLAGEIDLAAAWLAEAEGVIEAKGAMRAHREEILGELAFARGDASAARARSLEAAVRFEHLRMEENTALAYSRAALACVMSGEIDAAQDLGARARDGVSDAADSRRKTSVWCALALIALASGQQDLAEMWLERVRQRSAGEVPESEADLVRVWVGPWATGLLTRSCVGGTEGL